MARARQHEISERPELNRLTFTIVIVLAMFGSAPALAQWTVTNLHPAGATESNVRDTRGSQLVGSARFGGVRHAILWTSATSWIDLSPAGASSSEASAIFGGQQGGSFNMSGINRAILWSGSAASGVVLHPAAADDSHLFDISDSTQVGYVNLPGWGAPEASLWHGTSESWVNLNPAGAIYGSVARAVDGSQQVGYAIVDATWHASLWSGTAASWVSLNPPNSEECVANDAHGGVQVGYAGLRGGARHAGLWRGSAATWVDLNPTGFNESQAYGVTDGYQVGTVGDVFSIRASLWRGTAASWVDLSVYLPSGYSRSFAAAVSSDGVTLYVVGSAYNSATQLSEAMLWTRPLFCTADFNHDGTIDFFDYLDFVAAFSDQSVAADFNHDGVIDFFDYLDFVQAFSAGC